VCLRLLYYDRLWFRLRYNYRFWCRFYDDLRLNDWSRCFINSLRLVNVFNVFNSSMCVIVFLS
jgi:hypothetical protein